MSERKKQIQLGDRKYWFTVLKMEDWDILRDGAAKHLKEERAKVRKEAIAEAKELGVDDPLKLLQYLDTKPATEDEIMDAMEGTKNSTEMIYLSMRHEQPQITKAEVSKLIVLSDLKKITEYICEAEEPPGVMIDMKTLGHQVELKDGRKLTINEIIIEANKKKRKRKPMTK